MKKVIFICLFSAMAMGCSENPTSVTIEHIQEVPTTPVDPVVGGSGEVEETECECHGKGRCK